MNVGDTSGGSGRSQDFDLNLAPIIDCFTVLITFMLASASFLAIGVFDSSASAPGPVPENTKPPAINIEAELTSQKEIVLNVSGQAKISKKFAPKNGAYSAEELAAEVRDLTKRFPDVQNLTLSAMDDVQYLDVIRTMEALKPHVKTTLLGGF